MSQNSLPEIITVRTMKRYSIEKRVPNTEQWYATGREADTWREAENLARSVDGGAQTGVRIRDTAALHGDEPVIVVGC
jgi:hypothetical protein